MTATATPVSQAVAEWTKVFPKQITENYTSSVTFIKQLTVVAVSTITYLKNAFPEENYSLENFGGLKLRILKKKCRDELAHFLSSALTQAFEAFEKKYLHQLALCFYEDECKVENLVEYHVFEYSYTPDGVTMSVHSKNRDSLTQTAKYTFDNIRERTVHLIRACVVIMQTCQYELPENYDVSLRLYYNEDAPEGYQAPGFSASGETDDHLSPTLGAAMKLGSVETPYHKLVARSYVKDNMGSSREAIASQNAPMMSQMEHEDFGVVPERGETEVSEMGLRCPCNKQDGDAAEPLLLCFYCKTRQHAACFGLRAVGSRSQPHCCESCSLQDSHRPPTDRRLLTLTPRQRECLCIFRRTLRLCSGSENVSARVLCSALGVSEPNAAKLLRLLHSHGVISHQPNSDLNTPRVIIKEHLESVMNKFFQDSEENIVDRLLAETFASQESQPDPVGDILSPLEKVTLENATNIGRVVEHNIEVERINIDNDSTLRQYKEALLTNYQDSDMPLSGSHDPIKDIENFREGRKRNAKRKVTDEPVEGKPKLRTGVRSKKAKANL